MLGPQRWKLLNDPKLMQGLNGWLTVFWIVMIPISIATGWVHSVVYVSALSLWALVSGHWSAWLAARVEVEQVLLAARCYADLAQRLLGGAARSG